MDNGLSSNNVACLLQDSYGFLWTGGFDGLNRWDGHQFKSYSHSDANPTSVSQNIVYCLHEDRSKRLWIGHIGGLDLYNHQTDAFENIPLRKDQQRIPLNAIVENPDGTLWLATSNGLGLFNPETRKINWHYESAHPDSLSGNTLFAMKKDPNGNLWLGTYDSGLVKFNSNTKKFERFQHENGNPNTIASNKLKKNTDRSFRKHLGRHL
jgi:ligand-binding sensor domain-containing protein